MPLISPRKEGNGSFASGMRHQLQENMEFAAMVSRRNRQQRDKPTPQCRDATFKENPGGSREQQNVSRFFGIGQKIQLGEMCRTNNRCL